MSDYLLAAGLGGIWLGGLWLVWTAERARVRLEAVEATVHWLVRTTLAAGDGPEARRPDYDPGDPETWMPARAQTVLEGYRRRREGEGWDG
jgi:hypothetical protein